VHREGAHESAISVPPFKKPFALERLSGNPVQQVRIDMWASRFHQIAGETISGLRVNVQDTQAGIEPECSGSEPSFRFKHGVQIIQDCVRRIRGQPR
jgi:hypothetical protein